MGHPKWIYHGIGPKLIIPYKYNYLVLTAIKVACGQIGKI